MRTKNSSVKKIQARRNTLRKIMLEEQYTGKPLTRKELLKQLAEKGFDIDFATLYRDKFEINRTNRFIEEIAESNYSAMQEDIYKRIEYVESKALELGEQTWQISKVVSRSTPKGDTKETSLIKNEWGPKARFLRLVLDCQVAKRDCLKGDPVNLSFVMLRKRLNSLKEELELTKRQRNEYQRKNTKLKEKSNKQNLDQGSIT